ncbi:hypothetical protein WMF30_18685 [Sorangium sp. So ce134]
MGGAPSAPPPDTPSPRGLPCSARRPPCQQGARYRVLRVGSSAQICPTKISSGDPTVPSPRRSRGARAARARARRTADGWEETIAVNHLAAFALTVGLLPWLDGGRALFIGSGTIHPDNRVPRLLGFRGARFTSVAALARGDGEGSEPQRGRDRYATSKFMNTVTAIELARRIPPERARFYTLDPGMMPGTGLAREAPLPARVVWSAVLPWLVPLMPDASTPARSAAAAAWILTADEAAARSGEVYGPDRRPSRRTWAGVRDPQVGRAVVDESLELLGLSLPGALAAR